MGHTQAFGLSLGEGAAVKLLQVPARVLPAPNLEYGGGACLNPGDAGAWNLLNRQRVPYKFFRSGAHGGGRGGEGEGIQILRRRGWCGTRRSDRRPCVRKAHRQGRQVLTCHAPCPVPPMLGVTWRGVQARARAERGGGAVLPRPVAPVVRRPRLAGPGRLRGLHERERACYDVCVGGGGGRGVGRHRRSAACHPRCTCAMMVLARHIEHARVASCLRVHAGASKLPAISCGQHPCNTCQHAA